MRLKVRNMGSALMVAGALTAGAVFAAPASGYAGEPPSTAGTTALIANVHASSVGDTPTDPRTVSAAQASQPAARADDIHFVGPLACGIDNIAFFGRHQFFAFINIVNGQALPVCLADAGRKELGATRANSWHSGNNAGKFRYKDVRGKVHTRKFKKHEFDFFNSKVTVLWIKIN